MGFPNTVFGYIKVEGDINKALEKIEQLPSVTAKEWPPMPREMFSVVNHSDSLVSYKDEHIVHFGMCVKEINYEWATWLERFEALFKSMKATEAFVVLQIVYWDSGEFDGRFYYKWSLEWSDEIPVTERTLDNQVWIFAGSPREF
ncbi:hypothetical protein A6770_20100 [Nostoc minutum NIES-26]|uniref:Uncharacterized protein n=1 Tax=Nostoc minutum NIES-26 TaxID=1844469 RepID=A0A367R4H5_9NOSO|nr:hypothetical protein A6770_20100 [Nostoc minutum NIES-26]